MTKIVPVDQISEGMELDQPVKNQYGQLLIPASARLEEKHKKILKTWGVASVSIKEDLAASSGSEPTNIQRAEELERLYIRFGWKPGNPNEEDLFELVLAKKNSGGASS